MMLLQFLPHTCVCECKHCYFHLWMSCCVFCIDVMEASIRAMSFTSLLHRAHWFENPGHMTDSRRFRQCNLRFCLLLSVCLRVCEAHLHCLRTRVWAQVWCCCSQCSGCSWTAGCWPSYVSHSPQPGRRQKSLTLRHSNFTAD